MDRFSELLYGFIGKTYAVIKLVYILIIIGTVVSLNIKDYTFNETYLNIIKYTGLSFFIIDIILYIFIDSMEFVNQDEHYLILTIISIIIDVGTLIFGLIVGFNKTMFNSLGMQDPPTIFWWLCTLSGCMLIRSLLHFPIYIVKKVTRG